MSKVTFEPKKVGKVSGRMIASRYTEDGSFPKRGKNLPLVRTVAQLKKFLDQLPDKLPVGYGGKGLRGVWFNVGDRDEHLQFEEEDGF